METNATVLNDPKVVWYGPHACEVCGATVIRAASEHGGERFDVPERLMRVYLRGSEAADPALVYPQQWVPHVHRENPIGQPIV